MKLIITRHGETEENKEGIMQGHLPGKLSVTGINQAKKVALRLKDEKIDFIYSSDLARASDTATEIAKHHPNITIKFVEDLRERFLGEWQGKNKKQITEHIVGVFPPSVENSEKLFIRARNFLHKIISKHHKDTVLFVGHNAINKAMIAAITSKDSKEIPLIKNQNNTSISVFEVDEDKNHKIICFNCTKHLN